MHRSASEGSAAGNAHDDGAFTGLSDASGCQRRQGYFPDMKMVAANERFPFGASESRLGVFKVDTGQGFGNVKLAGFAIEAGAIPIKDAVGGVAVLLYFENY